VLETLIVSVAGSVLFIVGFYCGRRDATARDAEVRRQGTTLETVMVRMAAEERETGAIYMKLQQLENMFAANTGKELEELAKMMKESGMVPPRGERTHMPGVVKQGASL
jgi:hypothetical protein